MKKGVTVWGHTNNKNMHDLIWLLWHMHDHAIHGSSRHPALHSFSTVLPEVKNLSILSFKTPSIHILTRWSSLILDGSWCKSRVSSWLFIGCFRISSSVCTSNLSHSDNRGKLCFLRAQEISRSCSIRISLSVDLTSSMVTPTTISRE